MEIILKTGYKKINHRIDFKPNTIPKGIKLVAAGHVRDVQEQFMNSVNSTSSSSVITASVVRQMSVHDEPYQVSLQINQERQVEGVTCTCVYNKSGMCKHVAAVIYSINGEDGASKTSFEQEWGAPSGRQFANVKYSKGEYIYKMFPSKQIKTVDGTKKSRGCLLSMDLNEFQNLSSFKLALMAKSNESESNIFKIKDLYKKTCREITKIEEAKICVENFLIYSEQFPIYVNSKICLESSLAHFYKTFIALNNDQIISLCWRTIGQAKCSLWYRARKLRISSSSDAHEIKIRTSKSAQKLVNDLMNKTVITNNAMRYGLRHEDDAINRYEVISKCKVKRLGVLVSKHQPWLCTSIDGVVVEDGLIKKLLEIKCPFSCKNKCIVDFEKKQCNVSYLKFNGEEVELIRSHCYYTQIQLQLYVSGISNCDLFLYTPKENGSIIIQVDRDELFLKEVIEACEWFYFNYYLPELVEKNKENSSCNNLEQARVFTGRDISNVIDKNAM